MAKPKRDPTTASGFFLREEAAWQSLKGLWAGLPDRDLTRPGACGTWSVKDVMNHIASWMAAAREVIPMRLAGRTPPKGEYAISTFNPLHYARYRRFPLAASKRRLQRNRRLLLALLASLPERRLLDSKSRIGSWAKYSTYAHYEEHLRPLTAFRHTRLGDTVKEKKPGKRKPAGR
ncbi:MAG: maleylpyruvate isomerase N-terminal domain-containing protein [Anaerolineales bacterium]|nr:maleylpyruvate isomerase N-terminal domain-containing protein [Anaerolineales bacterium]